MTARATAFWFELSSWQRRWLLVAIGILVIIVACSLIPRPPQYVVMFGGQVFDRHQQLRFETAFARASLADFEIQDGKLRVPKQQRAAYLAALDNHGALPEALGERTREELGRMNPFQTQHERERRFKDAQCRDIAAVVRSLQGVEEAFLQLNESTSKAFSREKQRAAMVAIRLASDHRATPQLIHTVRSIVSSSQPGMRLEDVTIVDLRSGRTFQESARSLQATDEYLTVKETFERFYRTKIEGHLGHIQGLRVTANVELQRQPAANAQWTPAGVKASLAVPESYLARRAKAADGRQQAIDEIRRSALAVLPSKAGSGPNPVVNVETYEDLLKRPIAAKPSKVLTSPMGIGMMICFGLLGLVFVHAIIKDFHRWRGSSPTHHADSDAAEPISVASTPVEPPARVHERLTELVRENPRVAADTITEWVRKAG